MIRKATLFLFVVSAALCPQAHAQTWSAASAAEVQVSYEKAIGWFSQGSGCSVNINYATYTNYLSVKPYDQSPGFYHRQKNNLHVSSMGITTIKNETLCLIADTVNQVIILKNMTENPAGPVSSQDLEKLLKSTKALKKQDLGKGEILYRLEFKPNDYYSAFEFRINANGTFGRITYYYSKDMKEDEDNPGTVSGKPRMEISFSKYESNAKFPDSEFSLASYTRESEGKITLNGPYKDYELKDYRMNGNEH